MGLDRLHGSMKVTVEYAEWGGDPESFQLMRTAIAAAYERGIWDNRNCHTFSAYRGVTRQDYKNCLTVDYAEVNVRDGYKRRVRFSGPQIEKPQKYVCEGGRGYSNVFFNSQKPKYQKALGNQDIKMFTKCLDY
jgi:hypothetical protein